MSQKQIIFPLELLEKCINQRILIIMKDEKEFVGDLIGYDQNYSKYLIYNIIIIGIVLSNAIER